MTEITERGLTQRVSDLEAEVETQRIRLHYLENLQRSVSGVRPANKISPSEAEISSSPGFKEAVRDLTSTEESVPGEKGSDDRRTLGLPMGLLGLRSWEWWLNKVGIGLLLFGVAFLFKFSVDQGWLVPGVRVATGLCIGAVLVVIGLRVYVNRRAFSQTLLGGGIEAFYITGFAAFQLYGLISYPVAVMFMVAVTLLAFTISLRQNEVSLALIAGLGGFGTPFVLYTESGSLGGLVLYTCLILAGICAIYLYKGWRSLLLLSTLTVWTILFVAYDTYVYFAEPASEGRVALMMGVLFAWLSLSGVSLAREILRFRYPEQWAYPEPGPVGRSLFVSDQRLYTSDAAARLLTAIGPFLALSLTSGIWDIRVGYVGLLAMAGAALYALVSVALGRMVGGGRLSYTHALVALALSTLSLILILEGNALFFALAVEAALLHLASRRLSDKVLSVSAHLLFVVIGMWLAGRIVLGAFDSAFVTVEAVFFDIGAWIDVVVIAFALGISIFAVSEPVKRIYGLAAHVALLGVIWRELAAFPDSGAYISLAWGFYALGLVVLGLRLGRSTIMRVGLATLFVVVGKLFLVDLAWVGAVWRILLFLGFGGLFLVLSYYLQHLWRPAKAESDTQLNASRGVSGL